jgi:DNA polymerase III delta subunit
MIYLFHGSDTSKIRAKAFAWVELSRTKAPDAVYVRLDNSEITRESLQEITGSQSLFFNKLLVLLDDPFSNIATGDLVLSHIQELEQSQNIIAILAPKLLAAKLKKIEGSCTKVFFIESTKVNPSRGFSSALVNALGARDAQNLWKEIIKAYRLGDAPEMIHGLLHWKARDLMQKKSTKWTPESARKLSSDLIELVSSSRGGDMDLSLSLERFALKL